MRREPPPGVAERLNAQRALCMLETYAEARERLARERPKVTESFEQAVSPRLRELRAARADAPSARRQDCAADLSDARRLQSVRDTARCSPRVGYASALSR